MFKGQKNGFFAGVLVTLLALVMVGTAIASYQRQATLNYSGINITMDGEAVIPADANGNAVEPFSIDGTTYLPVRGIANALGLDVAWEQSTQTVKLSKPEQAKAVFITRTGSKYHYDDTCNGGTYWEVKLSTATGMGLTPCEKCVY